MQLDEKERALDFLKRALQLDPDFAEAHFNCAVTYGLLSNPREADVHLQKALELYRKQGKASEAARMEKSFQRYFQKKQE